MINVQSCEPLFGLPAARPSDSRRHRSQTSSIARPPPPAVAHQPRKSLSRLTHHSRRWAGSRPHPCLSSWRPANEVQRVCREWKSLDHLMVNGTKKAPASSPYTARHARLLFERLDLPRNLTWSSLIDGFHAAPTSNVFLVSVAGGHVRTIALRSSRLDCTKLQGHQGARPSSHWRCGFDAWQRYKRFEYYLYRY
jgi:hypothetical protein